MNSSLKVNSGVQAIIEASKVDMISAATIVLRGLDDILR